jgi:serine beta-lactamase-like protein LACTB
MRSQKTSAETWFVPLAVTFGLVAVAVGSLVTFDSTRPPLHPSAEAVPSEMSAPPSAIWEAAAALGRQLAQAAVSEQNLPGMSVAVGVAGEVVWAEGFGLADITNRTPVSPRTRFRIGHVSKALTSAGVGLLREQGRLHLDEEIQTYVPAFPKKEWPVTLRQVMGHVSGVRHYRDDEWGDKPTIRCDRAADGVKSFADEPLLFTPGTKSSYSTYGWVLVSAAVEAAANEPFFRFMRRQVFEPIGMADTEEDVASQPMRDRATSYYRHLWAERSTAVDYSCFAGGGAFLSTPSDLVRFAAALTDGNFLQQTTVGLLQTPQALPSGESTNYGLGWMIETVELNGTLTPVVGHASRTIEGASTSFLIFPDRGLVVAVSANISFADMKSVAVRIAQAFAKQLS